MQIWFRDHGVNNPVVVACLDKQVVGWAALSKYSSRCAYDRTVELSVYVFEKYRGNGIGDMLMQDILSRGRQVGIHVVLARITEGNEVSIYLHKKHGFFLVGTLKEVGYKFDTLLDVFLMEKIFK